MPRLRRAPAVDPAHLVPRSLGGCYRPECVVPVCRLYCRSYDGGGLELLPYLEPDNHGELAHAPLQLGLIALLRPVIVARKPSPLEDQAEVTGTSLAPPTFPDLESSVRSRWWSWRMTEALVLLGRLVTFDPARLRSRTARFT
jgi:hypothetical protein